MKKILLMAICLIGLVAKGQSLNLFIDYYNANRPVHTAIKINNSGPAPATVEAVEASKPVVIVVNTTQPITQNTIHQVKSTYDPYYYTPYTPIYHPVVYETPVQQNYYNYQYELYKTEQLYNMILMMNLINK